MVKIPGQVPDITSFGLTNPNMRFHKIENVLGLVMRQACSNVQKIFQKWCLKVVNIQ